MAHIHEKFDFTVSAFIMHPTEKKLCLHMHKKLGTWLQPGGHIEMDEDPIQALEHELEEETGLKSKDYTIVEPIKQPKVRGSKTLPLPFHFNVHDFSKSHKHIDLEYIIKSKKTTLRPNKGESQRIEWFSIEQIRGLHEKSKVYDGTLDICEWIFKHHM